MKYLGENSLTHLIEKIKENIGSGGVTDYNDLDNKPFTQLSGTEANPIYLRTLQTGAYILNGTCSPYEGSNIYMGANNAVTYVNWFETVTAVQIFYPPYNQVQYFEVYDDTYTTNTVALNDMATKLAGIENNANNYSLPTASESVLGGIKVGSGLSINNGVLSATSGSGTGNVSSDAINSIMVVDTLPETEVEGVLYLVKESVAEEETTTNLFSAGSVIYDYDMGEHTSPYTAGGTTYTFEEGSPTITFNGTTTSNAKKGFKQSTTLEAGKTYKMYFTNEQGTIDVVSQNYGYKLVIFDVITSTTEIAKSYIASANESYVEEITFTPSTTLTEWFLIIQPRSSEVTATDYSVDIVVEEVVE